MLVLVWLSSTRLRVHNTRQKSVFFPLFFLFFSFARNGSVVVVLLPLLLVILFFLFLIKSMMSLSLSLSHTLPNALFDASHMRVIPTCCQTSDKYTHASSSFPSLFLLFLLDLYRFDNLLFFSFSWALTS